MAHLRWYCMGRLAMTTFSTTERYNIVATFNQMVATLFQHSKAVLHLKPSLQIVSCNITFNSMYKKSGHLLPSLHFLVISSQVKWVFTLRPGCECPFFPKRIKTTYNHVEQSIIIDHSM